MPRVKQYVKRDPIKGLILEYQALKHMSDTALANLWGVSRTTCYKRLNQIHSDEWLGEAKDLCRKLGVDIDEFREKVRY